MTPRPPAPVGEIVNPLPGGILDGLRTIYDDLDREAESRSLTCDVCGSCCRLAEWGHEMWLTQIELSLLVSEHGNRRSPEDGVCPYLDEVGCTARRGRPLGCRVFFCSADHSVLEEIYERSFRKIRELMRENGIDVRYGEMLSSLRLLASE